MRQTIIQSHLINYYQLTAVNSGHRGLPGVWASRLLHLLANPTSCAALTNEKKHIRKILLCVKRSGKLPTVLQCEYEWAEVTHDCIYCKVPGSVCFFYMVFCIFIEGLTLKTQYCSGRKLPGLWFTLESSLHSSYKVSSHTLKYFFVSWFTVVCSARKIFSLTFVNWHRIIKERGWECGACGY